MNKARIWLAALLVVTYQSATADIYRCEEGVVQRDARTAAPRGVSVKAFADRNKSICSFSVNAEPIDPTPRDSDGVAQRAIQRLRQGGFSDLVREKGTGAIAQSLFGLEALPNAIAQTFGDQQILDGITRCATAFGKPESLDRVQLLSRQSENNHIWCGYTGEVAPSRPISP